MNAPQIALLILSAVLCIGIAVCLGVLAQDAPLLFSM